VRPVKNQLGAVRTLRHLNSLALQRELDALEREAGAGQGGSSERDAESENRERARVARLLSEEEGSDDDERDAATRAASDENAKARRIPSDANQEASAHEWGLLLLGPEVDPAYGAELRRAVAESPPAVRDCVAWLAAGADTQRIAALLFDRRNRISVVLNASRSEGQPQAILEAMVVTAAQVQLEDQLAATATLAPPPTNATDDHHDDQGDAPLLSGAVCAISDCPGNTAAADATCALILPRVVAAAESRDSPAAHRPARAGDGGDRDDDATARAWARVIDAALCADSVAAAATVRRLRRAAAQRAVTSLQPILEQLAWTKLLAAVLDEAGSTPPTAVDELPHSTVCK
jgi:hypothetical protein